MDRKTALAVLGLLESNPSVSQIKDAYRTSMRINHPDNYVNDEDLRKHAEEQCRLINEARDVLLSSNIEENFYDSVQSKCEHENVNYNEAARENHAYQSSHQDASGNFHNNENATSSAANVGFSTTPLLDIWKTSIPYSVFGLFAISFYNSLFGGVGSVNMTSAGVGFLLLIYLAGVIVTIYYSAVIYPSYFGTRPKIKSVKFISFLNWFIGGPVFGSYWNRNLTKKTKGISHIVFIAMGIVYALIWILY